MFLRDLFPCGDSMVCIIDDREDVWKFAPNLITVKKYVYFQGIGDINAPPGSREIQMKKKSNYSSFFCFIFQMRLCLFQCYHCGTQVSDLRLLQLTQCSWSTCGSSSVKLDCFLIVPFWWDIGQERSFSGSVLVDTAEELLLFFGGGGEVFERQYNKKWCCFFLVQPRGFLFCFFVCVLLLLNMMHFSPLLSLKYPTWKQL